MTTEDKQRRRDELLDLYGGPKKVVYKRFIDSGYYLPTINSPMISRDYLAFLDSLSALTKQRSEIVPYYWFTYSKQIAFCVLQELCDFNELEMGFDITNMPSKQWMVNMAYALDPEHRLFITVGDLASDDYMTCIQNKILQLPSKTDAEAYYRLDIVKAYKNAAIYRLNRLKARYSFAVVNLNHASIK